MTVHISEPTANVMSGTEFLVALNTWSVKNAPVFRTTAPPVHALRGPGFEDENAILASVFRLLATSMTVSEQMAFVDNAINVHTHRRDMMVRFARSSKPNDLHDRSLHVAARKLERMLDVLHQWAEALHQRACG